VAQGPNIWGQTVWKSGNKKEKINWNELEKSLKMLETIGGNANGQQSKKIDKAP
jgi:hypothetical protein